MATFATTCVLALAAGLAIADRGGRSRLTIGDGKHLQVSTKGQSFLRSLEFKHRLRVCNAYPYSGAVDVLHAQERLTGTSIPYKSCQEFSSPVKEHDKLQFEVGGVSAGSFEVSELPSNDAVLVLVIYRHDTLSTAVAFESHVFANLINAQIAVLDTYKGSTKASLTIQDEDPDGKRTSPRNEELRYDSVVAVNPGLYQVVLQNGDNETEVLTQKLVAVNRESYVVVRCGVEAQTGEEYPQELMVYPHSSPKALLGGAPTRHAVGFALFAALITTMAA